jgi:hypothetical protein
MGLRVTRGLRWGSKCSSMMRSIRLRKRWPLAVANDEAAIQFEHGIDRRLAVPLVLVRHRFQRALA